MNMDLWLIWFWHKDAMRDKNKQKTDPIPDSDNSKEKPDEQAETEVGDKLSEEQVEKI